MLTSSRFLNRARVLASHVHLEVEAYNGVVGGSLPQFSGGKSGRLRERLAGFTKSRSKVSGYSKERYIRPSYEPGIWATGYEAYSSDSRGPQFWEGGYQSWLQGRGLSSNFERNGGRNTEGGLSSELGLQGEVRGMERGREGLQGDICDKLLHTVQTMGKGDLNMERTD